MKRWLSLILSIVALITLIGWRLNQKRAEAASQAQQRSARQHMTPVVAVAVAHVKDITHTYDTVGSIEAPYNVRIAPKVTGRIDYLVVREGDHVTKGQVLVRLDPSEIEAEVRGGLAAVAEAQSRLAQALATENPTNVGITTQIEQQQAAYNSAIADYNQTKANYSAQLAAAAAAVTDAQGKLNAANAGVTNAQAGVRAAQANQENAQEKLRRAQNLVSKGFIAQQVADDAQTAANVEVAAVDVAQGQLRSAQANRDSALAQVKVAQQEASIVRTTGQANIESSRARLAQAKAALDMARANRAQKPAYQENLAALRAAVDAAKAALNNAEAQRAQTVLTSPLDGYVTGRFMDPGAMATPGTPILAIQEIRDVWLTLPVPEEVSRKIYKGQIGTATFDALPGRTFTGKVVQINPSADPSSRQFTVRLLLDNSQNLLKPGMFAHVSLVTDRVRGATVVPREAIHPIKNGPTVDVVNDAGVVEQRPVTLGTSDPNSVAVTEGVRPGEKVVVMSAAPVRPGQIVRTGAGRGRRPSGSGGGPGGGQGGRPNGQGRPGGAQGGGPGGQGGGTAGRPSAG